MTIHVQSSERAVPKSGLWEDIEPYLRYLTDEPLADLAGPGVPVPTRVIHGLPRDSTKWENVVAGNGWQETMQAQAGGRVSSDNEVAASVHVDIEEIKGRYIVGKAVGRDLYREDGQLIACHGERITHSIVRAAEESGKLVDLIEYMTFDSLED